MKRFLILATAISIGLFGCKEDDNGGPSSNNPDQPAPSFANPFLAGVEINADFTGRVTDMNGNPVPNALITIGSSFTSTDSRGFYQINNASVDKDFALIQVTSNNFFEQYRNLKPQQNEMNFVDIALLTRSYSAVFNASEGGVVGVVGGAEVTFPANGFVDADGQPYNGQVVVASTYLNPTDVALPQYIPGSLAAVDEQGQGVGMITYGMVGVEMISMSGQPLQLAEGSNAVIEFPIQDAHLAHAPDEIPLWYFNESEGIWYQEGSAVKVGNKYTGEVSHFSFWNCDVSFNTAHLSGTLVNSGNVPLTNLYVRAIRPSGQYAHAYVNAAGYFGGIVPAGEDLTLEFYATTCGNNMVYSMEVAALADDLDLGEIIVGVDINAVSVSGTVEDCDGNVLEGIVVTGTPDENGTGGYALTNADGSFDMSFFCLTNGTISVDVIDFGSATQLLDQEVVYNTATSDVYDMGTISFCDAEQLEMYFTYEEGDFEFLYPTVMLYDSLNCVQLYGQADPGMQSVISLDFGTPTSTGPAPVCSQEGGYLFHYFPGTQESYVAELSNYAVVITDFEIVDGVYVLLEGTYTSDVFVTGFVDGATISYDAVASGSFRYVP
jgi:hypothetical protein